MSSGLKVGIGGCMLLRAHNHSISFYTSSVPAVQGSVVLSVCVSSSDGTPGAQGSGSPPRL